MLPDPATAKRKTILIVDDDALLTDLFDQSMSRHGYDVLASNTGAAALELVNARRVDLVLLDMSLPDMPGVRVAEELSRIHPNLLVLIATGHDPDPTALPSNIVEVIRKPFSLKTLAARIQFHLPG